MAEIGRREGRSAYRRLIQDAVPEEFQTRVHQLFESIVFSVEPILRDLEYLEVRYGSGAPTISDYPDEGFGVFIDEGAGSAWIVLNWQGSFYIIGGSGAGSLPAHTHDHLTEITNVGVNTHAQVDTHIADGTIHFLEGAIDHENILNIGTNTHPDIDTHVADSTIHFTEASIDHGSISGLLDDDHTQYLLRDEWLQNGFVDYTDADIAWDDSSRTLEISPAVTSFQYYYEGILYTETGSLDATITDTEGLWAFYIGSGGAASLSTIHNPSYEQIEEAILNQTIVAYVYWDAASNDGRLMTEMHGSRMSPATHHYLHELFGAQYASGLTLGDITTDQNGNTDSHAQFSCTAGKFYDEDLEHETLARGSTDTWECYYVDGSGYVRWVGCEATFPVYAIGGVIAYNNAGTLTAVTSNKYCLYHVFATNIHGDDGSDYYPVVTPGIAVYNSKAEAQDAAAYEISQIDFGDWPKEEVIPVATVIYHHGAAMSNGVEAAIQSTEGGDDFVDWRFTAVVGTSTSVNDHGALSGLSDDDHPAYLLASDATDRATFATNWTDLTDAGQTTLHAHAYVDYYREPVTNGDPVTPEIVFDADGDVVMTEVPVNRVTS